MGAPGSGHTTKLLNNFLNAIALAATAEAMVAGRMAGLDLAQLLDVLNHSQRRQLRDAQPLSRRSSRATTWRAGSPTS